MTLLPEGGVGDVGEGVGGTLDRDVFLKRHAQSSAHESCLG